MSPRFVHGRRALALLTFLALAVPAARARGAEPINVSVITILATKKNDAVDPELKGLAECVKKHHPEWKLTGFRLGNVACNRVEIGGKATFDLVGDYKATVSLEEVADKDARGGKRVQVQVKAPSMGKFTYKCCCGKFLPVLTRARTKKGEYIMIAVRVEPCHGK